MYKRICAELCILMGLLIGLTTFNIESKPDVTDEFVNVLKQNRVAITCGDAGGQGTITNVDNLGVWVRTAAHVTNDSTDGTCTCMFNDQSIHTGSVSKVYTKSDESLIFVYRAYWPTHAALAPMHIGEKLYAFGNIHLAAIVDNGLVSFGWMFDNTLHQGRALLPVYGPALKAAGYPAPTDNMVLTNLYAQPGSSGEGVYDEKGNMVGIISGGSQVNSNEAIVVNVISSMEQEP